MLPKLAYNTIAMETSVTDLVNLRRKIVTICYRAKMGHISSALSCVDILYVLYKNYLNNSQNDFILSKGHAAPGLYVVLNHFGYLDDDSLNKYGTFGSILTSHPTGLVPGIQFASGALGLGLSVGTGMCLANNLKGNKDRKTFVLIGDGELNEGSVWESFMFAGSKKVKNLIAILDKNNVQASDYSKNIIKTIPLIKSIKKLGWNVAEVDDHNPEKISNIIDSVFDSKKPTLIVVNTVKGKGVSFMENNPAWHHRQPTEDEFKKAITELTI